MTGLAGLVLSPAGMILGNLAAAAVLLLVAGLILSVDRHKHGRFAVRMRIRYPARHVKPVGRRSARPRPAHGLMATPVVVTA